MKTISEDYFYLRRKGKRVSKNPFSVEYTPIKLTDYINSENKKDVIIDGFIYEYIGDWDLGFNFISQTLDDKEAGYKTVNISDNVNVISNITFGVDFFRTSTKIKTENIQKNNIVEANEIIPFEKNTKTYLMIDNSGYHKIGKSFNPKKRESTLQSEKPTIKLLFVIDKDVEWELHDKYYQQRIRGEWFDLTKQDVKDIVKEYGAISVT